MEYAQLVGNRRNVWRLILACMYRACHWRESPPERLVLILISPRWGEKLIIVPPLDRSWTRIEYRRETTNLRCQ
jgi:hypothetical protein